MVLFGTCSASGKCSVFSRSKLFQHHEKGRLERAKTLFASTLNGDLAAVIATIGAPQLMQTRPTIDHEDVGCYS
jgi:hypothetical protein